MAGHSPSKDGRPATPYVPAIHAEVQREMSSVRSRGPAWMPGTTPGMTSVGCNEGEKRNEVS
jgi:hypothetical protein